MSDVLTSLWHLPRYCNRIHALCAIECCTSIGSVYDLIMLIPTTIGLVLTLNHWFTYLESVQPPTLITRVTCAISKEKYWKASEYRAWLFYYSLPVMCNILSDAYYQHYILLCDAIYILNSASIFPHALQKCTMLIKHFYFKFLILYFDMQYAPTVTPIRHC